ncbi:MAG: hypothetical protein GY714_30515 [Desulfobacterales bacterium]|nr:hypothetical protein [Desulfobacterales bacterium]MCP4161063.1 hypothetical protein [Deltaproteobacteria bacterium]
MIRLISVLILLFFICGCSTLVNSSPQDINLTTQKGFENIKVEVIGPKGSYVTRIPTTIKAVSSYKGVTIKVSDDCYDVASFDINKTITKSFWVNFLLWPSFAVDFITGRYFKYDKEIQIPLNLKDECNTSGTGEM